MWWAVHNGGGGPGRKGIRATFSGLSKEVCAAAPDNDLLNAKRGASAPGHQPGERALWEEISKTVIPADFEFAFCLQSELQFCPQARERGAGCKSHANSFNIICFILIGKLAQVIFRSIFFPTQISVPTCSNSVSVTGIALVENSCYLVRIQTFVTHSTVCSAGSRVQTRVSDRKPTGC